MDRIATLKICGMCLCALYAFVFTWLGYGLAIEMVKDRCRQVIYKCPVWRSILVVSIFFVAAFIFGVFTVMLCPY